VRVLKDAGYNLEDFAMSEYTNIEIKENFIFVEFTALYPQYFDDDFFKNTYKCSKLKKLVKKIVKNPHLSPRNLPFLLK
jgi:hypothetical protein